MKSFLLPRLEFKRHLSPIFEINDESLGELSETPEIQRKNPKRQEQGLGITRRCQSAKNLWEAADSLLCGETLTGSHRGTRLKERSASLDSLHLLVNPAIFPDFRPRQDNISVASGKSTSRGCCMSTRRKPETCEDHKKAVEKQQHPGSSIATWLQFFG